VTQAAQTKQSNPLAEREAQLPGAAGAPVRRPTRVLVIESNRDGTVGGSHQALFDLVVGVDRASFEPVVLFYQDNVFVTRLRARGIEVVLFDKFARREPTTQVSRGLVGKLMRLAADVLQCRQELRRLRIDLLHLNNSPKIGNDNWLPAARLLGIPCVVTAMGNTDRPSRLIHRWLYRRFDVYLAISRYIANAVREQGVNPERIQLNYLGVDFDSLRARVVRSRESVRAELGVRQDQRLVLMVGNIRPWKGQREVIAALRMLPEQTRSRMRLCFAGATAIEDAQYEAELREEIAAGGLEACVKFLGPRSDVPDLYSAADIAVHASTTPEPFGLVVPEAMALSCAVIAASSGGPAEVIVPGTGVLCNPARPEEYARALEQLVWDDVLRDAIAAAAPARAALFGIERNVEGTSRAYRRALHQHS
jgi:glycosyltransferase involved in cell wall biosynthesis